MKKLFLLVLLVISIGLTVLVVNEQREVSRLKKISPVFDKTAPVVLLSSEDNVFQLHLYENNAAKAFLNRLPQTLIMTRWGEGAYGAVLPQEMKKMEDKANKRRAFFKGEVVLYQKRNVLFLMFGATPVALLTDMPMLLDSDNIPLGRLENWEALEQMTGVVEFTFEVKR